MKNPPEIQGILLVNKTKGKTSFSLVAALRRKFGVRKIGHAGTLDPFATGVMVMLIGRNFTRLSDQFLREDKEYLAQVRLGIATDTYDCEGQVTSESPLNPTFEHIQMALGHFQGEVEQIPPMYSAKKINGQKLCDLARKGKTVERQPARVKMHCSLLSYSYPILELHVRCSKGTYIRSIAHDLGMRLGCGAHLSALERTRCGLFKLEDCVSGDALSSLDADILSQKVIQK